MNDDSIRKLMEMFGFNIYDEYKREMDADIKTKITELLLMMDAPISDVNIKGVFEYINLIRKSSGIGNYNIYGSRSV